MNISRRSILLLATPAALYLLLAGLVAALYVHPPALGWIGFGVVALVATVLTAAAAVLFPRMRTNAARPPRGEPAHVLVLADTACAPDVLGERLARRLSGRDVLVVAPVLASPLHYLSDDEVGERVEAAERLGAILAAFAARSIRVRGEVGADDPIVALDDALPHFPATEIVVATSSTPHWLETDVVAHARRLAPTVEELVV